MKLVVGLGNPGDKYLDTRHNVGFKVIDNLASKLDVHVIRENFKGIYGQGNIGSMKVLLFKPYTFMNLSGNAVYEISNFFKIDHKDIIVVYDDMDLDVGAIRLRLKGSGGNHNGMKSVIDVLNDTNLKRVRVGIGAHGVIPAADYVLAKFNDDEKEIMRKAYRVASDAIVDAIKKSFDYAMTKYNGNKNGDKG